MLNFQQKKFYLFPTRPIFKTVVICCLLQFLADICCLFGVAATMLLLCCLSTSQHPHVCSISTHPQIIAKFNTISSLEAKNIEHKCTRFTTTISYHKTLFCCSRTMLPSNVLVTIPYNVRHNHNLLSFYHRFIPLINVSNITTMKCITWNLLW